MPEATGNNPPNPVDFMAALGNMAAAMQATAEALGNQINNGNNGNNGDNGSMILFSFLKVPDERWVEFGTYQLQGEAQHWWQGMRRILQPDGVVISGELFRIKFYKKYFPSSVRNGKELELLQLKQGQMTITEYTSKFEELCRFSRICQGALEDFAEWKCIKYEGGLRSDILSFVARMEIRVFSKLVNKSRIAEECVRNVAVAKNDNQEFHRRNHHQNLVPRGRGFKQRGYAQPFPHGRNLVGMDDDHHGDGGRKQTRDTSEKLTCQKCGRYHPNNPCRIGLGVCYKCGLPGHLATGMRM
ncbi:uncharacterized protein LOC107641021 [Arachis ipaensis]|uniref:uncharacterized protein LOC107641021 n=1 Tax=Arachis ipaensis TaxID=130454 RepID=UPI0007AF890A|nr:uncharacterized protein LOC107641021 [Arachis ipaensis]